MVLMWMMILSAEEEGESTRARTLQACVVSSGVSFALASPSCIWWYALRCAVYRSSVVNAIDRCFPRAMVNAIDHCSPPAMVNAIGRSSFSLSVTVSRCVLL
jgi:hypothetical protein